MKQENRQDKTVIKYQKVHFIKHTFGLMDYIREIPLIMLAHFSIVILLVVAFDGCATIPYVPENYNNAKIALVYGSYHSIEYTNYQALFRSEDLDTRISGVKMSLLEAEDDLFEYFRDKAVVLFSKAKIPNIRFTKNDIYNVRRLPRIERKNFLQHPDMTDYSALKKKGYTHVFFFEFNYALLENRVHIGTFTRIWTVDDMINQRFSNGSRIELIFTHMINPGQRSISPSVHFADNKDDDYYSAERVMSGNPNLYTRVVKAAIYFYLDNVIKTMQSNVRIYDRGLYKNYYLSEFFELYGNK